MPRRIQRKRTKGWRMPEGAVYVGRPTFWGNPYTVASYGTAALHLYRNTLQGNWDPSVLDGRPADVREAAYQAHCEWRARSQNILLPEVRSLLRGKDLACWCEEGAPCHADILLELANAPESAQ